MDRIKQYLLGVSTMAEPFILWGYSGCGKTSLLAKGYSQVSDTIRVRVQVSAIQQTIISNTEA